MMSERFQKVSSTRGNFYDQKWDGEKKWVSEFRCELEEGSFERDAVALTLCGSEKRNSHGDNTVFEKKITIRREGATSVHTWKHH